ncbi:hypothetical protein LINPERHAP2_LOCUS21213 [Linum perenne]
MVSSLRVLLVSRITNALLLRDHTTWQLAGLEIILVKRFVLILLLRMGRELTMHVCVSMWICLNLCWGSILLTIMFFVWSMKP